MIYLLEFFAFSFFGWVIDSIYCSISTRKIVFSGYFRGVPLCPIYGFGGILLLNNFALLIDQSFWVTIVVSTFLVVLLELIGGWFSEHFLDEKLWDYSGDKFNLGGYISAFHSFLWLIAITILYVLIGHRTHLIFNWLNSKITMDPHLEVIVLFAILSAAFWLTLHNKKLRLSELSRKRLAELSSIEEIFDFEKLYKLGKEKRKELLSNKNIIKLLEKIKEFN